MLPVVAPLSCQGANAEQRVSTWVDEIQCTHVIRFDPKKYDEAQIQNTADFLAGLRFTFPFSDASGSDVDAYMDACRRTADQIRSMPVVDLPEMEAYRHLKLEQLKDWCEFNVALIRGGSGDTAALREYAPSVPHCSRYVDALEGKTDIRQVWRDTLTANCNTNSTPETCKARFLAAEGQPDEAERIKRDVLTYGWQNCSTRYMKTGNAISKTAASMARKLDTAFRQRFRITKLPCAD